MKRLWTIKIPIDPIPKGRPRFGNGHSYTPKRTRDFETLFRILVQNEMRKIKFHPVEHALGMTITFTLKEPKRPSNPYPKPDLDNYIKTVDALNGICWLDDSQLVEIHAQKKWGHESNIEITLFDPTVDQL